MNKNGTFLTQIKELLVLFVVFFGKCLLHK